MRLVTARRAVVATVLLTLCPLAGMPNASAAAVEPPVIDSIDNSTPGTLRITLTSPDAPYVNLVLAGAETIQTKLRGRTDIVTIATGGYPPEISLSAFACSASTCSAPTPPMTVAVTDVLPDFAWPDDITLGPTNGPSIITINGDEGTGVLAVQLRPLFMSPPYTYIGLPRSGTVTLPIDQGFTDVELVRCRTVSFQQCSSFRPSQQIRIRRFDSIDAVARPFPPISPANPDITLDLRVNLGKYITQGIPQGSTATITWFLREDGTKRAEGELTQEFPEDSYALGPIVLRGAALPDMEAEFVGRVRVDTPDFGSLTGLVRTSWGWLPTVRVDRTGPRAASLRASRSVIYPWVNSRDYPASTQVFCKGLVADKNFFGFTIFQGTKPIRHKAAAPCSTGWNGRLADGTRLPPGKYTFRMRDDVGNLGSQSVTVTISSRGR